MKFVCAANWKMNKKPDEVSSFIEGLLGSDLIKSGLDFEVIIFPQNFCAFKCSELLNKSKKVVWGAQNCYFKNEGAFTGENSPEVIRLMGAKYVLVGHSERRTLFNEDNLLISKKVKACYDVGLTPMLCVGENQGEDFKKVLVKQLTSIPQEVSRIVIAYEPVWAIGTGLSVTPEKLSEVNSFIKSITESMNVSVTLLYGGSVKAQNAGELGGIPGLDGFLVGNASLKLDSFLEILHILHDVKGK